MNTHIARRRFGQNFLQYKSIINAIVRAANLNFDDTVIEIGPGLAALTEPVSGKLKQLHVIEIDRDIVIRLKEMPFANKLIIHTGDVLKFDFNSIAGRKKIIGNLPYNISTPLLFRLTEYVQDIDSMFFMLQKEVVERMCAMPNSKDYGRLSIVLQYFFDMEKILDVPPTAFLPQPKVDSAVVRMIPDVGRIGKAIDFQHFSQLTTNAFSMRRKTLRNNLKNIVSDDVFLALDIDPNMRPENIPPQVYVNLSNHLVNLSKQ